MEDVFIVAAARTPVGSFQGGLASLSAVELGTVALRAAIERAGLSANAVEQVVMGHVLTAGAGQNTARQVAIRSGLPHSATALTINQVCGSGLRAVQVGAHEIQCGQAGIVAAGGMESMSTAAHVLPSLRAGVRLGHSRAVDTLIHDGLWDAFNDIHMGITAENLARRHALSRELQDAYALESQRRATVAMIDGRFEKEIVPVTLTGPKGSRTSVLRDEQPRADSTMEGLARLRPAFDKEGTVTAGNSSTLNDGAAAVVLMSGAQLRATGTTPLARIAAFATAGVDPATMGEGPVPATHRCLQRAGWRLTEVDLVEANEAFAAQALTVGLLLGLDPERVNVNGGAISLGHPIGASGCRVLVTLLHEMQRRDVKRGLAMLCVGGGQGVAMAVER
ncbi:MAG: acetyl-CoA C-acetyltransferase [Steroidobacteraceae bacterium]